MNHPAQRAWLSAFASSAVLLVGACACGGTEPEAEHRAPDDHAPAELVRLSEEAVRRAGLRIEEVRSMPLSQTVRAPAEVRLDPDRQVRVAPLVSGQIAEVRASIGDRVAQGQTLAVLRSVELGETRAALAAARAELEVAEERFERHRQLVEEGIGAQRELVQARGDLATARARVAGLRDRIAVYGRRGRGASNPIVSPIDGEVAERQATVGEVAMADQTLFVIVDTSVVWVVGQVYAQDTGAVRAGATATLTSTEGSGRAWQGSVGWVAPVLNEQTRTLPVRVVIDNEDGRLRPGTFGTLLLAQPDAEPVPTVEAEAVTDVRGASVVFVPEAEPGTFRVRPVTVGRPTEGRAEVLEGLEPGDRYVADGVFVLKSDLLSEELGEGHAH